MQRCSTEVLAACEHLSGVHADSSRENQRLVASVRLGCSHAGRFHKSGEEGGTGVGVRCRCSVSRSLSASTTWRRRALLGHSTSQATQSVPPRVRLCLSLLANDASCLSRDCPARRGKRLRCDSQHLSAPRYGAVCIFSAEVTLWMAGTNGVPTSRRLSPSLRSPLDEFWGVGDPRVTFASQRCRTSLNGGPEDQFQTKSCAMDLV
jgi:hypothetical protein